MLFTACSRLSGAPSPQARPGARFPGLLLFLRFLLMELMELIDECTVLVKRGEIKGDANPDSNPRPATLRFSVDDEPAELKVDRLDALCSEVRLIYFVLFCALEC